MHHLTIPDDPDSPLALSLVVPTYNEAANIATLLARLTELLDATLPDAYEILVVDDDSPDRTWEVAEALARTKPCVRVFRRVGERGLATAVVHGWREARGAVLGVMDADLQHPPEVALRLWQEMARGSDLAVGSRHTDGGGVSDWKISRRVLSRGAQLLGLSILPEVLGRVSDPMSGCFLVRRTAIAGVPLSPIGYKILLEVIGRGRIRWISEVGYVFRERADGATKVTGGIYAQYLVHLLHLRMALFLRGELLRYSLATLAGVAIAVGTVAAACDPRQWGLPILPAALFCTEATLAALYAAHEFWTFRRRSPGRTAVFYRGIRFVKFSIISHSCLALVFAADRLAAAYASGAEHATVAVVGTLAAVWNFWLNNHVTWAGPLLERGITTRTAVESGAAQVLLAASPASGRV